MYTSAAVVLTTCSMCSVSGPDQVTVLGQAFTLKYNKCLDNHVRWMIQNNTWKNSMETDLSNGGRTRWNYTVYNLYTTTRWTLQLTWLTRLGSSLLAVIVICCLRYFDNTEQYTKYTIYLPWLHLFTLHHLSAEKYLRSSRFLLIDTVQLLHVVCVERCFIIYMFCPILNIYMFMFIIENYCTMHCFVCLFFRGLYITINDLGHVYEILCNWPEQQVKVRMKT